jgi:hypothetical protein
VFPEVEADRMRNLTYRLREIGFDETRRERVVTKAGHAGK